MTADPIEARLDEHWMAIRNALDMEKNPSFAMTRIETDLAAALLAKARRVEEMEKALRKTLEAIDGLMAESRGVVGLHLNGDEAPWSDLVSGGKYEAWLEDLNLARAALSVPATPQDNSSTAAAVPLLAPVKSIVTDHRLPKPYRCAYCDASFMRFAAMEIDPAPSPSRASQDVLAERRRQVSVEGWSAEHDDSHGSGQMARAAACYAVGQRLAKVDWSGAPTREGPRLTSLWPWDDQWWKPKDARRNLVRAGALIVAEIERLDREQE